MRRNSNPMPQSASTIARPSNSFVLSGNEKPPAPLLPDHDTNANSNVRCTTMPATELMPTDAVAPPGSTPTRCNTRTPSAIPPVPAGVMLDVNDDATRERAAAPNGTRSATEPTNDTAAKKYV